MQYPWGVTGLSPMEQMETNTQMDQPATQTQTQMVEYDDFDEPKPEPWARLIRDSGPTELHSTPADAEGHLNCHILGRSAASQVLFNHTQRISNKHCTLYCKLNLASPQLEAWVVDSSANGTYINGHRLTKHTPRLLHHRDEISLVNPALALPGAGPKIGQEIRAASFVVMLHLPTPPAEELAARMGAGGA
ncbi:SMAD/FHA domain-containing protein, partial [Ochromonadaceae sp. CCMP2298]